MATIFSKIINREIPAYIIAESDDFIAFLDVYPLAKGHTLVVPKKEIDYIFDMNDKLFADFNVFAKKISIAIKKAIICKRIGTAVIGLEVPHAHIHLIPINNVEDINFARPKLDLSREEFEEIAENIRKEIKL
ncbi:MAG: HIT family protein [Bacteroidota bacterium]